MQDAAHTGAQREDISPLALELDFLTRLSPFAWRRWFERSH
jgi:hypothetical protein